MPNNFIPTGNFVNAPPRPEPGSFPDSDAIVAAYGRNGAHPVINAMAYQRYNIPWVPMDGWVPWALVIRSASQPTIRPDKEASSKNALAVFAILEGQEVQVWIDRGNIRRRGPRRLGVNVKAVTVVGYDFDEGDSTASELAKRVRKLGYEGLVYTTHSHTLEKPKLRLLLPLAIPYETPDNDARTLYKARYTKFGEKLHATIDPACSDVTRCFYLPVKRSEDAPYEHFHIQGELLDFNSIQVPVQSRKRSKRKPSALQNQQGRPSRKNHTRTREWRPAEREFDLQGLELATLIVEGTFIDIRSDKLDEGKIEIACPFDEEHSNAGDPDDRACCVWNASASIKGYAVISCRHAHCADRLTSDFVAELIDEEELAERLLANPDYRLEGVE